MKQDSANKSFFLSRQKIKLSKCTASYICNRYAMLLFRSMNVPINAIESCRRFYDHLANAFLTTTLALWTMERSANINQQDWNLKRDVKEFRKTPDSLDNPINISLREFVSTFATVLTPIFDLILKPIRQIAAAFHHLFIDILACPDCVARKRIKRDANAYVYRDAFTGGPSITGRYCVPANRTIYGA